MRRASPLTPVTLVALAWAASVACSGNSANRGDTSVQQAGTANSTATVKAAIDSSLAVFVNGMMKGDSMAMTSVYAADAMVLAPGAKMVRGQDEIRHFNASLFSAFSIPSAKITNTDVTVSGDYAFETGTYAMTMQPKKGKAMADSGKYLAVWQKQADGSWKMIRDTWNSDKTGM